MAKLAVDQVPAQVAHHFIEAMRKRGEFWYDMFVVALDLGLRNVEVREMQPDMINLEDNTLTLFDSKQVRAYVTKKANKQVDQQWLIEGRKLLRHKIGGDLAPLLVRMAVDTKQLAALAEEYDLTERYKKEQAEHYAENIEQARTDAAKTAPEGRTIDLSPFPGTLSILRKRQRSALASGSEYLWPANELNGNRAKSKGFEPVTRQSAKRIVDDVNKTLRAMGGKIAKALEGIRLGLHSCRKAALQRAVKIFDDILEASKWLGHGNGEGDLATTTKYMNRSEQAAKERGRKMKPAFVTVHKQADKLYNNPQINPRIAELQTVQIPA
jgi:integrase